MFVNNLDPVAFEFLSFQIRWYSLAYIFGFLIGWFYIKNFLTKDLREKTLVDDFITYLILGVIIGGRLGYVIFYNFFYYLSHPFEIFLSMMIKIGAVYVLGPAVFAVILFEIILNATAIFNHANLAIPKSVDKVLRLLLVTPDMHRIHHSRERKEHDTNFGFALSVWDRIFKTYKNDPIGGQSEMKVGLDWQDDYPAKLTWTLFLPFKE